jgi:hypothetical protein
VMATDRSTLAASFVTCACPKPNPLFNSLKQISTGHLLMEVPANKTIKFVLTS